MLERSLAAGEQASPRPPPFPRSFVLLLLRPCFFSFFFLSSPLFLRGRGGVTERDRVRRVQARSWLEDSQRVGVLGGRRAGKPTPPLFPRSSALIVSFSSYSPSSYPFFFFFLLSLLRCSREGGSAHVRAHERVLLDVSACAECIEI